MILAKKHGESPCVFLARPGYDVDTDQFPHHDGSVFRTKGYELDTEHKNYFAYLLRVFQVVNGETALWRASLEDPHTGERRGFADIEDLIFFLRESVREKPKHEDP